MKKVIFIFLSLMCFLSFVGLGQNNTFYRKYNLSGMNGGLTLQPTSDGGFVAAGQHEGNGSAGGCDIYVYRVDECGNRLWFKIIGGGEADGAKSIQELSNGDFLISGHYDGSTGFVSKLDQNGNLLWLKTYPGLEWVFHAVEAANGDIICVAKQPNLSCVLMRLDGNGNVLWSKNFSNFGQMPLYVHELTTGEIVFLSTYNVPGKDMALAKTDANGTIIWTMAYGVGYSDIDHTAGSCSANVNETNNTILLTTPSQNQGGQSGDNIFAIEASLSNGSIIWSKSYGGPGSDQSRAVIATPQGYAICGNSDSYPVNAGANNTVSAGMYERNILLFHIDYDGNIIWSRQYGAESRDKGIGVGLGLDGSFTISAYTASTFFGNADGSMDPLFIKTDSLGFVNCQTADCPLQMADIQANASPIGSSNALSFSASIKSPVSTDFAPNDIYQCQDCYTVPFFGLSDSIVCVGETVYLFNLTTVGLTCFQEWQINGITFNGNLDTIAYSFQNPGLYHVLLSSTCGGASETYDLAIRVSEVVATVDLTSNYNGYGVSCNSSSDGSIEISATGGYFPSNQNWNYTWTPSNVSGANLSQLTAGVYNCVIQDAVGCTDSLQIVISEPPVVQDSSVVSTNYNGFDISCAGGNDGGITLATNFPVGGVAPYSYALIDENGNTITSQNGTFASLSSGVYEIQTVDLNGCSSSVELMLNEPEVLLCVPIIYPDTCLFDVGAIQFAASGGVQPYQFSLNGNQLTNVFYIDSLSQGAYTVSVQDGNNCISEEQMEIIGILSPDLSGAESDTITCGREYVGLSQWTDLNSDPTFIYYWEDAQGVQLDNGNDYPSINTPGNYYLIAFRNDNFCRDTLLIQIYLDSSIFFDIEKLQIANVVTRNSDNLNDCWNFFHTSISPESIESYIEISSILIYNRWGDLLVEMSDSFSVCDELNSLADGTYYYIIKAKSTCGPEQEYNRASWFLLKSD